jgi:hypothetical protein
MAERHDKDKPSELLSRLLDPKVVRFGIETREDPKERDERLRKEFLSFLLKDLSTYVLAVLIVLVAIVSCSVVLVRRESTLQEKSWAMSVLSSIFTGAVGFAFGKSASK